MRIGRRSVAKVLTVVWPSVVVLSWIALSGTWSPGHDSLAAQDRSESQKSLKSRKDPSILCFVLVNPARLSASKAIKETWGRRCDALLFFSSVNETTLPLIGLSIEESYGRLWGKMRKALTYLHHHYGESFDWFLKADDDTYVIVENLRKLLSESSRVKLSGTVNETGSGPAVWFGCRFKNPKGRNGYMSGGAGYVLSREALRRVVVDGFGPERSASRACSASDYGFEDLELGRCLEQVGVEAADSRDSKELPTFVPFAPWHLVGPQGQERANQETWYWNALWWPHQLGKNCCSVYTISFHKIPPTMMYAMDFLLYHLRV